ncbi:unnamed protein product, partial [Ectocarpus fasciculatus]
FCRYLEQCEAIRDREHDILPPLTPEDLDSKADRFTGVLNPKGQGGSDGSRRRRRHHQEDFGGHSSSQDRVTLSAGANAILSARMALSIMGSTRSSGGTGGGKGDEDGIDVRREGERGQHQQSLAAAGSSIAGRANGLAARIAAAQRHASDERATHSGSNSNNATTTASSAETEEEAAGGGTAAAVAEARGRSLPTRLQGRSLMSAKWNTKPGKGAAAGRRGHPRYPTKGMTPESWTATGKDRDTTTLAAGGDLPAPSAAGVGGKGKAKKEAGGGGDGCLGSGSGSAGGLSTGGGQGGKRGRGGGAPLRGAEGVRGNKRGLGRDWEGLYQVRPFDDTPE